MRSDGWVAARGQILWIALLILSSLWILRIEADTPAPSPDPAPPPAGEVLP